MKQLLPGILAMAAIVVASNILVQFLAGPWLTWGAFTYPFAFLVTDLTNRLYGPAAARRVVLVGFVVGVICSLIGSQIMGEYGPLVSLRVAIGSGVAFLAAQLTDVAVFRDAYDPLLMRAHTVDAPDSRLGNEAQALKAIEDCLAAHADTVAAVIVEPLVQGAAGMVMHSPDYLRQLRALCTRHGVHLIADEIAVGCGRTGRFFAWQHTDPATPADWPDFLLLSKGITGGTLPLSLVLTTDAVFDAFWSEDTTRGFLHSHSYTGNPAACAAALAVLDRFDAGQEAQNTLQAQWLADAFAPLARDDRVRHLRQRGTILAFDVPGAADGFAERFHLAARAHELLIRPIGRSVYLMPPYLIDPPTAAWLAEAVTRTLNDVV